MSEENKIVELKEEDLEKVSGGGPNKGPKELEYKCNICNICFSDKDSLHRHNLDKHSNYRH